MHEVEKVSIKKFGNILEITLRLPWPEIERPQLTPPQQVKITTEATPTRKPLKYDLHLEAQEEAVKRRKAVRAKMRHKAVALRLEGKSVQIIARMLAKSPATIYAWIKAHKEQIQK